MKIVPIGRRVIIEPNKVEVTDSDLMMPEMGKTTPVKGKVLMANPESDYKEGDIIFFRRYAVDELKYTETDGTEVTLNMVDEEDIVAKLEVE